MMQRIGGQRPIGLIIGLLVLAALAFFVFRGCAPGQSGIPDTGVNVSEQEGRLGRAFAASQVGQDGCPVENTTRFDSADTIYVGFEESEIPRGTSIFARLSREGRPLEDANEITADQDMLSCVWFEFQPGQGSGGFDPGQYSAELFINGNSADRVDFTVTQGSLGGPLNSDDSGAQLGRLAATTRVDRDGCPTDSVASFRPDEPVYVAYDQSFIPTGTEIFARLLYEGQTLEDTNPIRADQDLDACFWFVFEPERGSAGFDPGLYETQVFVNGAMADQIQFEVR